jgi:hypothetical protein
MPQSEARAWWADVQHVRESIERRRAGLADSSAPLDAPADRRFVRRAAESLPALDDLEWASEETSRPAGRFDRTGRASRGDHPRPRAHRAAERRGGDAAADRRDPERETLESAVARLSAATPSAAGSTAPAATALAAPPARRTVQITGRPVPAPALPRLVEVERRRPARRPAERVGPRPDRIALWAVLLGFFLILVAATSSNAAVHPAHADRAVVALHAPAR